MQYDFYKMCIIVHLVFYIYNINSLKEFTAKKKLPDFLWEEGFWLFCYFSFLENFYALSFPQISHYLTKGYFCISDK